MRPVHLWDNSLHRRQIDEPSSQPQHEDSGHDRWIELSNGGVDVQALRTISSRTIGDLMADEDGEVVVWPHSVLECDDELKDQYILSISEKDGKTIDSVRTYNVVGFIGFGTNKSKVDIRIHSRFSPDKPNNKDEVNDDFLYYMLEKVMGVHVNMANLKTAVNSNNVLDLLYLFLPRLLKEALAQGMYKKYVYHEYNDANIRGVVDVNRHIRLNIPANGKIAYRTREFSYDNCVTQLIRHTIEFIRRKQFGKAVLHNDPDTEGCVQQIIQATPTYQAQQRQAVVNDNLRPVVHPYYTKYAALQKLCLRILRHEKLSYGNDSENRIHGLLIDAAWLWEEYVGKVLSERGNGLNHYTRKNSRFELFEDANGRFQKVIPDYYDKDNGIVADAKYIPLHRSRELSADRAAPIYYKTIMYMYRFDTKKGFLFHPCSEEDILIMAEGKDIINIEEKDGKALVTSTTYNIETRQDCLFHKVGLVIPNCKQKQVEETIEAKPDDTKKVRTKDKRGTVIEDYIAFRTQMDEIEQAFSDRVSKLCRSMTTILYIHGLSSSGNSHTAKCLRELLTDCRVLAPDVPVHPIEALEMLHRLCREEQVDIVVGTSMGGMYAQQMYGLPRIIVNPGFHVSELLIKELGNEKSIRLPFFSQRQDGAIDFVVDAQLIREFQEMEAHQFEGVATDTTPADHIYALFGNQDEVVNCEEEYHLRCRGIIEHFNGGHRLNEDVIRSHIIPRIWRMEKPPQPGHRRKWGLAPLCGAEATFSGFSKDPSRPKVSTYMQKG